MPGASEQARRIEVLNANWVPAEDGGDGRFEIMMVTDDGERHTVGASPASVAAVVALARADTVLLWDPAPPGTFIAANVVGRMPWTDRAPDPRPGAATHSEPA